MPRPLDIIKGFALSALVVGVVGCASRSPPVSPTETAIQANTAIDGIDNTRKTAAEYVGDAIRKLKQ